MRGEDLKELQRLLKKFEGTTAAGLATFIDCGKGAIYRRIRALAAKGAVISEVKVPRKGVTGPAPVRYYLVKEAKL